MRPQKGQTLTIGAIFLILVILAVVASVLIFTTDIIHNILLPGEEEMGRRADEARADLGITGFYSNEGEVNVTVMNVGEVDLPSDEFETYIEESYKNIVSHNCGDVLEVGERCNLTIAA